MSRDDPMSQEQVGLHVLLTALGMSLLSGDDQLSDWAEKTTMAARWYHDRFHYISALMHDEPLYNAMRVIGRDPRDLDSAGEALWSRYWTMSDSVSDLTVSHRSEAWNSLVAQIASAVVSDEPVAFDLVPLDEMAAHPVP